MKKYLLLLLLPLTGYGQVVNTAVMDTTDFRYQGKVTVEGYIDAYYSYDFNRPKDGNRPYFVSMNRHNEVAINLAYVDVKYSSSRLRGRFVPGFGSYINSNYSVETGSLKNIVEASAGIKVSQGKNIWLDAGVFGSPYTNESAISKDHLAYTRSFAPEYVPYYLTGVKLTVPLSSKVTGTLYLLNGWQQIIDQNRNKSIGTQIEYRPSDYLLINWNTYAGNENSATDSFVGLRLFTDIFFIYSKGPWSATSSLYIGQQEKSNSVTANWWQANLIGRYNLTPKLSLTGRVEYFDDPKGVQIATLNSAINFSTYSSSLGLNYKVAENMLVRVEGRSFFSKDDVYVKDDQFTNTSQMFTTNLTLWF